MGYQRHSDRASGDTNYGRGDVHLGGLLHNLIDCGLKLAGDAAWLRSLRGSGKGARSSLLVLSSAAVRVGGTGEQVFVTYQQDPAVPAQYYGARLRWMQPPFHRRDRSGPVFEQ
jgi:hypothetical protein